MSDLSTERLAELVQERHACLEQMHALAVKQQSLIEENSMTELLDLLVAKQRFLGALQEIEAGLRPFRDERPEDRTWRNPAEREACSQRIEACEALLADIIAREKQGETLLAKRRDETAEQLQTTNTAHRAHNAYADSKRSHISRLDISSS